MVSSPWCFSYSNLSILPCLFRSYGEQNQVTISGRAKMWTRNEPILLSLWFLSTVGFCMILLPCLKVYSISSTHIFSHAILQNKWSFQSSSHFLGDFWSCTEKCYGCSGTISSIQLPIQEGGFKQQNTPRDVLPSTDNTTVMDAIQATRNCFSQSHSTYQSSHGINLHTNNNLI